MTHLVIRAVIFKRLKEIVLCSTICFFGLMANFEATAQQRTLSATPSGETQEALKKFKPEERKALQRAKRIADDEPKFKVRTGPDEPPGPVAFECTGAGNCSCTWAYDCADMALNAGCKAGTLECGLITCSCNK
ncbi:hypothetical protein C8R21_1436 [Nitrosospira multiformis]|jgi:hypothetical protein|uniref:Uncharacterized protein n=1 Tax=Nitrosospira multiformis TaxID=1231 RepID=A0A2T5I321_9PROT|nr:hypothetical protein C8R21_1436 [Nitrosospira multiformis]